jgi:hypothetical protein
MSTFKKNMTLNFYFQSTQIQQDNKYIISSQFKITTSTLPIFSLEFTEASNAASCCEITDTNWQQTQCPS